MSAHTQYSAFQLLAPLASLFDGGWVDSDRYHGLGSIWGVFDDTRILLELQRRLSMDFGTNGLFLL